MKYIKFAQISADTGVSWAIAQPVSGPSWPNIAGLNLNETVQLAHSPVYYLGKASDSAEVDPDNHIFELTQEQYAEELRTHVMHHLNRERDSVYQQEHDFRNSVFSRYHETASIAGVYKYQQAKELLSDATAAAVDVRAEAAARGITAAAMAQRIVTNHEDFRAKEARIAGIRGKVMDRLSGFAFDMADPDGSYSEYLTQEVIGTRTEMVFEGGQMVEKEVDVTVGKYSLSLSARFQYG